MDDLYLVRKGNEQFWCQPEQVDYWASQGYTVFALTPERVAGPDIEEAGEDSPNVEVNVEEHVDYPQEGFATERIGGTNE